MPEVPRPGTVRAAQVEVSVEIDDAESIEPGIPGQREFGTLVCGPGDLVSAAESEREVAAAQESGHQTGVLALRVLEPVALAGDVARVVEPALVATVPREITEHAPQLVRSRGRARPTVIAPHACIAGEAGEGNAGPVG